MGCACVIMGVAGGAMYCGMIPWAIDGIIGCAAYGAYGDGAQGDGAQGGAQGGAHVAANGAAYVGAGAQYGAGAGAQYAPRLNQLHGQNGHSRAQQQPLAAGSIATASKISVFFMVLGLLGKQRGDYCFGRDV